jgi:hypothetical protein
MNSAEAPDVPHVRWDSVEWAPFEGTKPVYCRYQNGKVVFCVLRAKGTADFVWPFDEFLFVTQGWVKIRAEGSEPFTLIKGEVMLMKKGQHFFFEMSEDFANVVVFLSDCEPVAPA